MLTFKQFFAEHENPPVTDDDLKKLEHYLDYLYGAIGIDIAFTKHFLERVNDERNKKQITTAELTDLFRKAYQEYGNVFKDAKPGWEAVLSDNLSDVNVPFAMNWDARNKELDLVSKTVMRKRNFKTPNKKLPV